MRYGRLVFTCSPLFIIALIWNGVFHLVLLANINAAIQHLHRPDLASKMWLSLLLTAGIVILFVLGHQRFVRSSSIREGAIYGMFFALLAGLLVDLNQYVLYPIPAGIAALWFIGGLVEFMLYGILTSKLLPKPNPNIRCALPTVQPGRCLHCNFILQSFGFLVSFQGAAVGTAD